MALITCPDCQRQVSAAAPACPNCGRPIAAQPRAYQPQSYPQPYPRSYEQPAPWRAAPVDRLAAEKQNVQIAYGLWAGSYVFGPLGIASLILCYMKRGDARGTYLEAHYDWLIETFWNVIGGMVAGLVVIFLLMAMNETLGVIGMIVLALFGVGWPIYRLIKGWTALNDGRPPEDAAAAW